MSCETLNQGAVRMEVSMAALPEGFCPENMQELGDAIATRLIVTPSQAFTSFATGSVAPTSNVGPWFKDCETWFIWDDATASYIPMTKQGFNNEQYSTASGSFVVPDFIYKLRVTAWGGGGGGANAGGAAGGGGGGGAFAQTMFNVTPNQVIPFVIGSGGTNGLPGNAGTSTTFLTLVAGGGAGGNGASGGAGGVPTGQTFGINGGAASSVVSGVGHPIGHAGSSPQGGSAGVFELAGFTKINGVVPGGGGAPSNSLSNGGLAGSGASGGILIEW